MPHPRRDAGEVAEAMKLFDAVRTLTAVRRLRSRSCAERGMDIRP